LLIIAGVMLTSIALFAQNTISGELTGTVTDPTGAVLPSIAVTLKSNDTGQVTTTTTTAAGFFRFALLRPGTYTVSASPAGFATITHEAIVSLGQVTNVKLTPALAGHTEVLEVTSEAALLQTENANVTANFSQQQIESLPAPGNDMTNYALTAPGVTLSTGAGYGNFTAYGLPGTSNLFTVNGSDNNDPFNGLANSGASNNTLGVNELQEVTIVTNGYTGQYGRAAGANVNYSTKSGTNQFHGNAEWQWNGRVLNANDWFNNNGGTPRPFANANAWAGSIGGPIKKDKLFFFYDNEGMRYVLPGGGTHYIPSPLFASDTLANIGGGAQAAQLPFYQNFFKLYQTAATRAHATPVTSDTDPAYGCGDLTGNASNGAAWGTANAPCAYQFAGGGSNMNTERLMALKIDVIPTQSDKLSFRWWEDRGTQATFTDPISSVFNASSNQPQDQGQFTYTKTLNSRMVNQFLAAGSYYSAVFSATDLAAARAAFPTTYISAGPNATAAGGADGLFDNLGGEDYAWPQGRRVAQYQFSDDFSWTKGDHNLKFGLNIRRNNITDLTPYRNTTGELFASIWSLYAGQTDPFRVLNPDPTVKDPSDGKGDNLTQRYTSTTEAGFALYSLGVYVQDEWRASAKLKLTFSLRADRNSNESCAKGCIARFAGPFADYANADGTVPYNQTIQTGLKPAFPGLETFVYEPRFGFAYTPWDDKTVFRGGIGLFSDLYPGQLAEPFASNAPFTTTFEVGPGGGSPAGSPIAYNAPGGLNAAGLASYNALLTGFAAGSTYAQISQAVSNAGATFSTPSATTPPSKFKNPKYIEWNFEIERALDPKTSMTINYVGNHGYDEVLQNGTVNTFNNSTYTFPGLSATAPDSRFNRVIQYTNSGFSNYNGLTAFLSRRMSYGLSGSVNYTWSHSTDLVSNGGLDGYNLASSGSSILTQLNPLSLRAGNYGSSDYDFRHNISANYVWQIPYKPEGKALNAIAGGWAVSGTVFFRTGEPFSAYRSATSFMSNASGNVFLPDYTGGGEASCNHGNDKCLQRSQFILPGDPGGLAPNFGNIGRNAFRGPKYFNTDMTLTKKFKLSERSALSAGASFYNLLNHPNFANPSGNLASGFGKVDATATPPSSPYGNFQGAAVSGRIIQTMLKVEF
jgi:outer membrane receptor protein involved in Fe transport